MKCGGGVMLDFGCIMLTGARRLGLVLAGSLSACALASAQEAMRLAMPVACEIGHTCVIQNYVDLDTSPGAQDHTCGTRTYDGHNGTDFRLPSMRAQRTGVYVTAAADGIVARARDGAADVSAKETGKPAAGMDCGNGLVLSHPNGWETQYCHLERGSLTVKVGQSVKAGQKLGRVGLSGFTEYPHLHFTVRHEGRTVDPFAYKATGDASCGEGISLWDPSLRDHLAYEDRSVLNTGFADAAVSMGAIETDAISEPSAHSAAAIIAFVRSLGLKSGDRQTLSVRAPDGRILAEHRTEPLDKNMAQTMIFAGRKRPESGWDRGQYRATYTVELEGRIVLQRDWTFELK